MSAAEGDEGAGPVEAERGPVSSEPPPRPASEPAPPTHMTPVPPEGFEPEPAPPVDTTTSVPEEIARAVRSLRPSAPPPEPTPSIRAMRVVAISNRDSLPVIESTEAALDEFDAELSPQTIERLLRGEDDSTDGFAHLAEPEDHHHGGSEAEHVPSVDLQDGAFGEDLGRPPDSARELSVEDLEASVTEEPPVVAAPPLGLEAPLAGRPPPPSRKPPPPKRSRPPPGGIPSAKPRVRPWWETLFGDDFARAHRSPSPTQLARQVDFICESLGLRAGSVVLDLGCGQGEHAVEMARRGVSVVGYDLSVFQLAMAGDRAQEARQKINFLQGDMREMAFDSMFDAVLCWDTSFGFFEEEKNSDVARRVLTALRPGGSLLLDVMNRDFAARESPTNLWFEGDGCVCMDDVDLDWITSRLRVKRSLILDDGRSKELHYSLRLYSLSEIGRLLHDVGFRVAAVSGDVSTPGGFFGPTSPRIIIRAERP